MELWIDGLSLPGEDMEKLLEKASGLCLDFCSVQGEGLEISLTLVDAEEIQTLNREYRDKDQVTDVLSFPLYESPDQIPTEGTALLGDIVICLSRAEEQASEYGHSLERELAFLFVHSMFHLLGFDHEDPQDTRAMREAEESVLAALGLSRRD
jgi:probable rRNA maturation factor